MDWTTNFWGDNGSYWNAPSACGSTSPFSLGHVSFSTSTGNPPSGPVASSNYLAGTTWCAYDRFQIGSSGFVGAYQPGEPTLSTAQAQAAISLAESDPRVIALLAGRTYSAAATAWMTVAQPASILGGLATLSWSDAATFTTAWPVIHYDETEQSSPPYTEGTHSYTATGAKSLDVLVDLTRNAVVSIEPGVEAERSSGSPLKYLPMRFDPGGGTDYNESQGVPTGHMRRKCFYGDCFFNFDFAPSEGKPCASCEAKKVPRLHPKNADNPIGLILTKNASVDLVKAYLWAIGFQTGAELGSPMYAYITDNNEPGAPRWDTDQGVRDANCILTWPLPKTNRHVRVYGGANDRIDSFSTQWGFYVAASAHYDVNECPGLGTTWHGKSELVEDHVADEFQGLGFPVLHDLPRLGNAQNWVGGECAAPARGKHRRCNDGFATMIEIPNP